MPLLTDACDTPSRARRLATVFFMLVAIVLTIQGVPATAQEDEERLEELKEEREAILADLAAQASLVDTATADVADVVAALDAVNALVDLHETRLAEAEHAVESAESLVAAAAARSAELATEQDALEIRITELSVAAFTGEPGRGTDDITTFLLSDDPTEAARRRSLIEFQTGSLGDAIDLMRQLREEAADVEAERVQAVRAAVEGRTDAIRRRTELQAAEDAQVELVLAAEVRLEARLAEAQALGELDAAKAAEIQKQEEEIARRIREEAARRAAAEAARRASARPVPAAATDMVTIEGFTVHKDVADSVGQMIRDARAANVNLTGYGWRSPQRTAELRVINGCPDVYESSPSSCRIPTARPGTSMHERGLAIDFQSCWRGSDCFTWLSNNAARYGFYNLPSESWHWSTNGR